MDNKNGSDTQDFSGGIHSIRISVG
jgi:hypothetical protein